MKTLVNLSWRDPSVCVVWCGVCVCKKEREIVHSYIIHSVSLEEASIQLILMSLHTIQFQRRTCNT